MDVVETIYSRTSYRGEYLDTPVPRADLETIVKAGLAAPSGCNKQTTSIIAIDDPALIKLLYEAISPAVGATSPAMVCVLAQQMMAYRDSTYFVQDYSAATQNMLLAIVALGYQSCWVEGHITDTDNLGRKMADILGVPGQYELVCYLPVGLAKDALKHVRKKPMEERGWFNGFGKV